MNKGLKKPRTIMKNRNDEKINWFVLDASGKTLGRLASEVAKILRGKHKPTFTPHADTGDGVIILNAGEVHVSGRKKAQKVYRRYTGFQSGLRETSFSDMLERKPEFILEHALKGMMPKTRLGRAQLKRLRVYAGNEHTQEAQLPVKAEI